MSRHTIVDGLAPPPGYAHVVEIDESERLIVTAGAVPLDRRGDLVGDGDLERQTRQVVDNLAEALRAAGTDLERVIRTTVYVVANDRADLSTVWEVVRASDLSRGPHASTLLGVTVLGYTGQLVEIEALAVTR